MVIKNDKPLDEVLTQEEFDKFMALPVEAQADMTQEYIDHIHTLWNRMTDLYDAYAAPLVVLGVHLELNIFVADRQITHAELGVKEGVADILHEHKED